MTAVIDGTTGITADGSLKLDSSGGGTFTITPPSSATDRTLTLPDEAGTVLTSGGGHLMVDKWYLSTGAVMSSTSCFLGVTDSTVVSRDTTASIGSPMTVGDPAGDDFAFPRTGIYKITFMCTQESDNADVRVYATIDESTDSGSSYSLVAEGNGFSSAGSQWFTMSCMYIANVSNVSTYRVRFAARGATGATVSAGSLRTYMIFERLGEST